MEIEEETEEPGHNRARLRAGCMILLVSFATVSEKSAKGPRHAVRSLRPAIARR